MNWQDFTNYLKEKIISLSEYASQEEYELTPFAKEKYGTGLSEEEITDLETNLHYLLISYQQRFDSEGNFHELPEIEKEIEEEGEESDSDEEENEFASSISEEPSLKTWIELYPIRQGCLLGKSENGAVSLETYNLLGKIYEDWRLQGEKAKELGKKVKTWNKKSKKWMKEYISQQASEFFKKKGINVLKGLKDWLRDYESLSPKQQEKLKKEKKEAEEAVKFLEAENLEKREEKGWFKKLDWKSIGISTGIGIVFVLILLVIRRWFKS